MFDLGSYLASRRERIDNALNEILKDSPTPNRIIDAMKYSLMAGGKRIRPILCMAAAEAVGGKVENALTAACALEMIHTYSLIHDDLPAMDDDVLRRGKPTCHVAFDEATAILAGDALLTLAFEILSFHENIEPVHASKWLRIISRIAVAAGYKGMVGGQMQDITSEGRGLSLDALESMHTLKTGALIEASMSSGAILGGGTPGQVKQLEIYGKNIGLAFQVTDDILNVEGDPAVMGKAVGTDKNRNKTTYPSIMGLENAREFAKKLINDALQALDYSDIRSDPFRAIALYIVERKR